MKTVLRIAGFQYTDLPNPYNMIPRKGDCVVYKEISYTVSYVEFDFDNNTLFLICYL